MKRKINWFKFIRFIFISVVFILFTSLLIDIIKYPDCYISTWKYQLRNEILNGAADSIEYYEETYVENNRDLFNDNFEIRNIYIKTNEVEIIEEETNKPQLMSLGKFVATAYTIDTCGKTPNHPTYGITKSGTCATSGRTVAVDPEVIPLGTTIIINGHEYVAEDTGGDIKGNRIDICFNTIEEALQFGRQTVEVFIYE